MSIINLDSQVPPLPFFTPPIRQTTLDDFCSILESWQPAKHVAVYLHMPFCSKLCKFCRLSRGLITNEISDAYSAALVQYVAQLNSILKKKKCVIQALFIGGGTPTSFKLNHLERIIDAIDNLDYSPNAEVTIESSFHEFEKVKNLVYKSKINRISFGLQVANSERHTILGRMWDITKCMPVLEQAHSIDLTISADILYGLQGLTQTQLKETCKWILASPISGVELNSFVLQQGTPLYDPKNSFLRDSSRERQKYSEFLDGTKLLIDNHFLWDSPCQLSRNKKNNFLYEKIWHHGGDCLAIGPGVKGRLNNLLYYTSPSIGSFTNSANNINLYPLAEIRIASPSIMEDQKSFFSLLKGNIYLNTINASVVSILEKNKLIKEKKHNEYVLTTKGRFYVSNIATLLFEGCIETRKNKIDWFERQKRS